MCLLSNAPPYLWEPMSLGSIEVSNLDKFSEKLQTAFEPPTSEAPCFGKQCCFFWEVLKSGTVCQTVWRLVKEEQETRTKLSSFTMLSSAADQLSTRVPKYSLRNVIVFRHYLKSAGVLAVSNS